MRLEISWWKMSSSGTQPESFRKAKTEARAQREKDCYSIIPQIQASNFANSSNESETYREVETGLSSKREKLLFIMGAL